VTDRAHLAAAADVDIAILTARDRNLHEALADDAGVLNDEQFAQNAMKLYASTIRAFDPHPDLCKQAFKAVVSDDTDALQEVLLKPDFRFDSARNACGQTLLEVARERKKPKVEALLRKHVEPKHAPRGVSKDASVATRMSSRSRCSPPLPRLSECGTDDAINHRMSSVVHG